MKNVEYELTPNDPAANTSLQVAIGKDGDLTRIELVAAFVLNGAGSAQQVFLTIIRNAKPDLIIAGPVVPAGLEHFCVFAIGLTAAPLQTMAISGNQTVALPLLSFREALTVDIGCTAANFQISGGIFIARTTPAALRAG